MDQPVQTGLKSIDSMVPVGRGQRELIIGDRQTGKTAVAIDAIINQRSEHDLHLRRHRPEGVVDQERGALAGTKLARWNTPSSSPPPLPESAAMQYVSAYSGCTMGEYISATAGKTPDHLRRPVRKPWAYRQVSLLLRRPPASAILATCSISTAACSSAPPASTLTTSSLHQR